MSTSAEMVLESTLPRRLEWSCWKTNNETNKLVVGLWKTSQDYEVTFCHERKQLLA